MLYIEKDRDGYFLYKMDDTCVGSPRYYGWIDTLEKAKEKLLSIC